MGRFTKMAGAITVLFALLCAGCGGSTGAPTTTTNNNAPSGTIQGSAK